MGSIPTLTPISRRESRHGAGCIPREYLQQYFLIGSTPIPSTSFLWGPTCLAAGVFRPKNIFSTCTTCLVRFQSPRQFIDEAGTHSVSTQPTGGAKCSGNCESCTGAASGSGGCAGSATYESSILSGSTSKHSLLWQYKKASGTYGLVPRSMFPQK